MIDGRFNAGSPLNDDAFQPPTAELSDLITDLAMYEASQDAAAEEKMTPEDIEADLRDHHRIPNLVIGIVLIIGLIGGFVLLYFGGLKLMARTQGPEDYPGPGSDKITITIPKGADLEYIANLLYENDIVKSPEAFYEAAKVHPSYFADIQAADYVLFRQMRAEDALRILGNPDNTVQEYFRIIEGMRNTEVFAEISEVTGIPIEDLQDLANNPGELGLPEWARGVTEGYLSPNTYAYDATPTAMEALKPMVEEFNRLIGELGFVEACELNGINPFDAVVMAGLVEREGGTLDYAADIAGVFYNRLEIGMPLQSDATVLYAGDFPSTLTVTNDMLAVDSPYNTYLYEGLTPTAISNPGRISLLAAANPGQHTYLYFVATDPSQGIVKFAETWEEHEANVAEFDAWCDANPVECGTG